MNLPVEQRERRTFLARVASRELAHLQGTDKRLFVQPFTVERADAFVARFGRLQDTVGDKLLPAWLAAMGERPATALDNLDRAERLGIVGSADDWMMLRRLRNQMIHEYIEDPAILADALQVAHQQLALLENATKALIEDLAHRGMIPA